MGHLRTPHPDDTSGRIAPLPDTPHRLVRRGTAGLAVLGVLLAGAVFQMVASQPSPVFHPWRDAELRATYTTFLSEGVPLIKVAGTGSPGTQVATPTGLAPAAWDDDPGIFLATSYVGRALGVDDPYEATTLFQAVLAALPWVWLPLTIGRLFGRASVGLSAVVILPLLAVMTGDVVLLGTDYGRLGRYVVNPIYALYGAAASLVFVGLMLLLLICTLPRRRSVLWGAAISIGALAGMANLMRAASGIPVVVAAVCVLWFLYRIHWSQRVVVAALTVLVAGTVQLGTMQMVNAQRSESTGLEVDRLPIAHGTWHPLYLGLGFIGYDEGDQTQNPFGIIWLDEFAWNKAREIEPDVVVGSAEYDRIMRDYYFAAVRGQPGAAIRTYLAKLASVLAQQGSLFVLLGVTGVLALRVRRQRHPLVLCALVGLPAVVIGLIPPVLVMPMRYYFVENTAGLAIILVGAVGWATAMVLPDRQSEAPESTPSSSTLSQQQT